MKLPSDIVQLFPPMLGERLVAEAHRYPGAIEEIRCRVGQACTLLTAGSERAMADCVIQASDLDYILERATLFSFHAYAEELRAGFVHTDGGGRIGVCGTITENGLRGISSLTVRIPHEVRDCAKPLLPALTEGELRSTLIVSPPGAGKTTLLRDLIRLLSERGYRVSVADERGEISAMHRRRAQFDLGPYTDVFVGGRKHEACMMLLRAMNPQILAFDEITAEGDIEAALSAVGCGVTLLATAHAADAEGLQRRPLYRRLLQEGVFAQAVEIRNRDGVRSYQVKAL